MEAPDFVGPPGHCNAAPLGQKRRMMTFLFGQGTYGIREPESGDEVCEHKRSLQSLNLVLLYEIPLGNLDM